MQRHLSGAPTTFRTARMVCLALGTAPRLTIHWRCFCWAWKHTPTSGHRQATVTGRRRSGSGIQSTTDRWASQLDRWCAPVPTSSHASLSALLLRWTARQTPPRSRGNFSRPHRQWQRRPMHGFPSQPFQALGFDLLHPQRRQIVPRGRRSSICLLQHDTGHKARALCPVSG